MPLTNFPQGISSFGMPVIGAGPILTTGKVLFVGNAESNAADSTAHGGDPLKPLRTLDYAIGLCTASKGDVIVVMPGHAETVTSAITCDVAGVQIIGIGVGRNIPTFTGSGAVDVFNVTAASVLLKNVRVVGASANVTALINIAAADFECQNCRFSQAETPLTAITVASGADRFHFADCTFRSTANGPDHAFDFESSASDDWIVERCFFNYMTNGLDNAVFRANADATSGGIIKDCVALGLDAAALFVDFNSSHAVGEGMIVNCTWQHLAAATIANGLDLGGYATAYVGGADGPVRAAELLPATSAS